MSSIAGDPQLYTHLELVSSFIPLMSKEELPSVTEMVDAVYSITLKFKGKSKLQHTTNLNVIYRLIIC